MVQITRDEITDLQELKALVKSLGLKELTRKLPEPSEETEAKPEWMSAARWQEMLSLREPPEAVERRRFLRHYFIELWPRKLWHNGEAIWLRVHFGRGSILQRIVITGLKDEREAAAVWLEADYHRTPGETLHDVVERVVMDNEREAREYHRVFLSHLRHVRDYFEWQDGEAVPSAGRILPIEKSMLNAEDIELLRQVFMRLRYKSSPVPHRWSWYPALAIKDEADAPKLRNAPIKKLTDARKRVKQLSGDLADAGVSAWVNSCLVTKTDQWTRATPLYEHYRAWIGRGGDGQNRTERAEAKATALSIQKWGKLMRLRFPDGWRQDKRSILYRTVVKRGA